MTSPNYSELARDYCISVSIGNKYGKKFFYIFSFLIFLLIPPFFISFSLFPLFFICYNFRLHYYCYYFYYDYHRSKSIRLVSIKSAALKFVSIHTGF
jgi:hypothetical protein